MTFAKLGGVFIVATLVSAWLSIVGIKQHLDLAVAQAQPGGGFMYVLPLPNLSSVSDVNEAPTRSRLTLFEDTRELGPPHSLHTEIAGGGSGRFSHYRDHLYFSARDNSDVRTNGHTYYAVRAWKLPRVVPLALGTLTAALFLVLGWRVGFRELPRLARERMRDAVRRVVQARATLLRLAAFASIFAALLTIVLAWSGVVTRVQLDNARAEFASGHMYAYEMARLEAAADTNDDPFRSSLVVYEDGRRLGPPHTMHSEIVSAGAGRFSHYSQYLYFSASDNSDVTKNGRSYSISYPSRLNPAYAAVSVLLAALFVVLLARTELGIAFGSMRAHHIVEAFRRAGGVYLIIGAGLIIAVRFGLLLYAAPDMAAEELDLLRRGLRRIVSLLLGVGGGAALYFQARSPRPRRLAEAVAGFIFLLVLGSALSTRPLIFAACVAFGVGVAHLAFAFRDRRLPRWFGEMGRQWLDAQGLEQRQWVWRLSAGAVTLTLINVVPEVVLYWDQSGWMDSRFYDVMAHDIARGVAPFGNSEYAPVYQYAMAALYWSLGHFFFVQQVANVALACATAVCMCWAAWFFFRNLVAVACMGLLVAYWDAVHHAVWYTQIENIYVPLFAASILALAFYLSSRSRRAVALMAVSAAVVFCTRQQSAFYVMALPLAVLLVDGLSLKERGRQLLTYGMVFFLLGVLPWSLRNWHQEDRFSPSSRQSTTFLAVLNDPRIPFHAIRYWERSAEVRAEWVQRYPNEKERNRAMQAYFRERLFNDTNYFVSAAPWRLAAFYGLLPGVYLANDWSANKPIDFLANWGPQLRARYDLWVPVALSLIALAWRWRSSTAWLLFALVGANVLVGLLVGSAEPRTCYPVLLLHFSLACALLCPFAPASSAATAPRSSLRFLAYPLLASFALLLIVGLLLRTQLGARSEYRTLPRTNWNMATTITIDRTLPLVTVQDGGLKVDGKAVETLAAGRRYRAWLVLSCYMFPPRHMKGLPDLDPRLALPTSVQYYSGFVSRPPTGSGADGARDLELPLRYDGSHVTSPLKEHQFVEAEFVVEHVTDAPWAGLRAMWSAVEKATVVREAGALQ